MDCGLAVKGDEGQGEAYDGEIRRGEECRMILEREGLEVEMLR